MLKKAVLMLLMLSSATLFAKKLKFAVDMTGQNISPNGVHVSGDFQTLAGYPGGDWNPGTTPLAQEGSTLIYSVVVDVPASRKYEYKFVNGNLFYESEFVAEKSRVGHDFNDNRWIYVDSLSADTMFIGNLLFGTNAPAGKKMVRFLVDMQMASAAKTGVHVSGDFNAWSYTGSILYNFANHVYESIEFVDSGEHSYKFVNGNLVSDAETVPGNCANLGNRSLFISTDTILSVVCYSECTACKTGSVSKASGQDNVRIYPNPSTNGEVNIKLLAGDNIVFVEDISGRIVSKFNSYGNDIYKVSGLKPGLYFIQVFNLEKDRNANFKVVVQ